MAGWQIALIALGAALVAATAAVLLDRARPPAGQPPHNADYLKCPRSVQPAIPRQNPCTVSGAGPVPPPVTGRKR